MTLTIRPETPADYERLIAIDQLVFGFAPTPDDLAKMAADPGFISLVAERDGLIVGSTQAGFMPEHTPAGDLRCRMVVHPDCRNQGVGGALWDALQPMLRERRPAHLRANGNGKRPEFNAFAEKRGFRPTHRLLFQSLDLTAFDPSPWLEQLRNAEERGFRFVPFSEMRSPDGEERLYRFFYELEAQTPDAEEAAVQPFAEWRGWALEGEGAWPEGWTVAVAPNGDWMGLVLAKREAATNAHILMTGLDRAYQGQGLAIPLKIAAAIRAKGLGVQKLTTLNHSANERILRVNQALGYQVDEDLVRLVKRCEW